MGDWLKFYHRLPYSIRVVAASIRGYILRRMRYGSATERLVAEALERETWDPERWQAWQQERLVQVLHRARTRVPYYRELWDRRRRAGDRRSWERLEHWPILKKESLRRNPRAFLADDCHPRRMVEEHTSGSTGTPLTLWWSRETVRRWYALFEARWRGWYGLSRSHRWAILGGQLVTPVWQKRPPFWVWNQGLWQLYLSAYHVSPETVEFYLQAMARHHVTYLLGYPSGMAVLAQVALERDLPVPQLRCILSNAEPLFDRQRRMLQRAFGCPVYNTYGMSEIAAAASECQAGQMHLWPEAGIVEVFADEDDVPVAPGETGRLICTGLLNADMPLIRYEVGDRGALAPQNMPACACGRTLPRLHSVDGRLDDVVITPDGRRIGRLDPVLKADLPVREMQIVQESVDGLRVRVVPGAGFTPVHEQSIRQRLRERVGDMTIEFDYLPQLPRGANGKVRFVISKVHASYEVIE